MLKEPPRRSVSVSLTHLAHSAKMGQFPKILLDPRLDSMERYYCFQCHTLIILFISAVHNRCVFILAYINYFQQTATVAGLLFVVAYSEMKITS